MVKNKYSLLIDDAAKKLGLSVDEVTSSFAALVEMELVSEEELDILQKELEVRYEK